MASITTDEWIGEMMKDMGLTLETEQGEGENDNTVDYNKLADVIIEKMNNANNDNEEQDITENENESEENE